MADEADAAGQDQEFLERVLLEQHRRAAAEHSAVLDDDSEECLNCQEPIAKGRFCDAQCREDYQKRARAHSMRR